MSFLQLLSQRLVYTPLSISLIAGVVSSSYFFCGNLTAASFGIIPAIQDKANDDIPLATKIKLWKWCYDHAKAHFAGSTATSAVSFCAAAYFTSSHSFRALLLCPATFSFIVIPFTLAAILPINNQLIAIHNSGSLLQSDKVDSNKQLLIEAQATDLLNKWVKLNRVRMILGACSWIAGIVALITSA